MVSIDSGCGLANATIQQRLVPVRLFFDFLVEEGVRESNPVGRGRYTPGRKWGGQQRGLVPRVVKLPWIPTERQWLGILVIAAVEPPRNRVMLALAYDAAFRREELCSLRTDDFDPGRRMLRVRAETTKNRLERVVPYSAPTGVLLQRYLAHRAALSRARGPLFLSESRRNQAEPLSLWTWSKVVRRIAIGAGVPQFSTHTTRHLCLTDLARMGWELHAIATFAGHRSTETTLTYIHLSGRELADKLARGMDQIHAWRVEMLARLGEQETVADDDDGEFAGSAISLGMAAERQPFPAARHDRLSGAESDALQTLGFDLLRLDRDREHRQWQALQRLTAPLDEALAVLHWHPDTVFQRRFARYATAIVLHRCGQLGRDFWSWSNHDWADLLRPQQLRQRFPGQVGMQARPYLLTHAYLLTGFTAFDLVGPFARRVGAEGIRR